MNDASSLSLRKAVTIVGALNFAYFFVEFAVASRIGSVSLFADSVDFLEDALVNFLIVVALEWSAARRATVGGLLSLILLVPGIATLWTAYTSLTGSVVPEPGLLSATGLGALVINVLCAYLLSSFRNHSGSLTRAAFLSARNDAVANVAIIGAGMVTAYVWRSGWPDLIVGLGIAIMNMDAAREVWKAAREERKAAA